MSGGTITGYYRGCDTTIENLSLKQTVRGYFNDKFRNYCAYLFLDLKNWKAYHIHKTGISIVRWTPETADTLMDTLLHVNVGTGSDKIKQRRKSKISSLMKDYVVKPCLSGATIPELKLALTQIDARVLPSTSRYYLTEIREKNRKILLDFLKQEMKNADPDA